MEIRRDNARPRAAGPILALILALAATPASTGGVGAQDAAAGDTEALAILEEASQRYAATDGFCAEFEQLVRNPLLGREAESEGTLCQMDPGYFRMDFSDPDGDRIVADGEYLWVYYPSSDPGQVIRQRPAGGEHQFDFHSELLSEPGERYAPALEGREEVDGHPVHVLDLTPTGESPFERAKLWIDANQGLIRKVELEERDERTRRVELAEVRVDPGMTPEDFAFRVPDEAQVIDR